MATPKCITQAFKMVVDKPVSENSYKVCGEHDIISFSFLENVLNVSACSNMIYKGRVNHLNLASSDFSSSKHPFHVQNVCIEDLMQKYDSGAMPMFLISSSTPSQKRCTLIVCVSGESTGALLVRRGILAVKQTKKH